MATSPEDARAATALNRDILGLYDGDEEKSADSTRLHRLLEMPLNHLGYRLRLHDISKSLPDPAEARRYHAVATWFSGRVGPADSYLAWAANVARSGVRFVVLDSVGALGDKEELPAINGFLAELGLAYALYYVGDGSNTRIVHADRSMLDFEHKIASEDLPGHALPGHQVIVATSTTVVKHLTVTDPEHKWAGVSEAALVVTGPGGGLIASGFAIHYDQAGNRVRWIVDPFRFLEAALGRRTWPIPDTTTVSGRRLYFSHIDGDGWLNATTVQPHASTRAMASEVVLERLVVPYPDLPVSVGLIAGDISTPHGGRVDAGLVALRLFALPQVEVASHTYTHPYRWAEFEAYDRERELDQVQRHIAARGGTGVDGRLAELVRGRKGGASAIDAAAAEATLARARVLVPFSLDNEVTEALRASQRLAPAGKEARLYLWSGDTRPFEAAVKLVRASGARNLNGGDSRFDAAYPSVAYVAPLSRRAGAERQIYAVNSNENTYTNGWQGPFDGFKTLTETLDNTERPRRLKGFNLYYHMYSATRPDSLAVIESHLELARRSRLAPISASDYAAIAEGFFAVEIVQLAPLRWQIAGRGGLETVRFEAAAALELDDVASRGVVGYTRDGEVLYVTLDADVEVATVALRQQSAVAVSSAAAGRQRRAHLVDSRWRLAGVSRTGCEVRARAQGFGRGEMLWQGFAPGTYEVGLVRDGKVLAESKVKVGPTGLLELQPFEVSAIEPLQLRITCLNKPTAARLLPASNVRPKVRKALVPREPPSAIGASGSLKGRPRPRRRQPGRSEGPPSAGERGRRERSDGPGRARSERRRCAEMSRGSACKT